MPERLPHLRRALRTPAVRRALGGLAASLVLLQVVAAASSGAEPADPSGAPPEAVAACPRLAAQTRDVTPADAGTLILCAINAERVAAGVAPLRVVDTLTVAAQGHTRDMVARGDLEHGDLATQLQAYARGYGYQLGENVGETSGDDATVGDMVGAWMGSDSHRTNILDGRFHDVGIGVLLTAPDGTPGATYTTDFGSRRALAVRRTAVPASRPKARRRARIVRRRHL